MTIISSTEEARDLMNSVSPSFCMAKWLQHTIYLQNGMNHSCHHPPAHKIPVELLADNPRVLHNTPHKKKQMQLMLDGVRPSECDYCWKIEDMGDEFISDRIYKSNTSWSKPHLFDILQTKTDDIDPTYMEISFSNVCNLKCVYCGPDLSSKWMEEIKAHGPHPTSNGFNGLELLDRMGKMPIPNREKNPYVDAFWEWWPTLYPNLHTLRLTGGEPLLSKDCWRVLDRINDQPREDLVLAINTNLSVSDTLIDKLIDTLLTLGPKIREIQIFTSGEAKGAEAEYTRYGLDYDRWLSNCRKILTALSGKMNIVFPFMTTVNILSVGSFASFMGDVMSLRKEFVTDYMKQGNILPCMTNFLRYPHMLSLANLDDETKQIFENDINNLIETHRVGNTGDGGFLWPDEVNQLQRMIGYMNGDISDIDVNRRDFVSYVDELDKRRGTVFADVFPNLAAFSDICRNT